MKRIQYKISYEHKDNEDIWHVEGGKLTGKVVKIRQLQYYICDCPQYSIHKFCSHIKAVIKSRRGDPSLLLC